MVFERRTLLELAVDIGGHHDDDHRHHYRGRPSSRGRSLVRVTVHLRSKDLTWWNEDLHDHKRQLYRLLRRYVLPREFGEDDGDDGDEETADNDEHAPEDKKKTKNKKNNNDTPRRPINTPTPTQATQQYTSHRYAK